MIDSYLTLLFFRCCCCCIRACDNNIYVSYFCCCRCLVGWFADDAARQRRQFERRRRNVGQRESTACDVAELPVPARRRRSPGNEKKLLSSCCCFLRQDEAIEEGLETGIEFCPYLGRPLLGYHPPGRPLTWACECVCLYGIFSDDYKWVESVLRSLDPIPHPSSHSLSHSCSPTHTQTHTEKRFGFWSHNKLGELLLLLTTALCVCVCLMAVKSRSSWRETCQTAKRWIHVKKDNLKSWDLSRSWTERRRDERHTEEERIRQYIS